MSDARTPTESGLGGLLNCDFDQILRQIVCFENKVTYAELDPEDDNIDFKTSKSALEMKMQIQWF